MTRGKISNYHITFLLAIACCIVSFTHAQVDLYPASYGTITEVRALYNPALINTSGRYTLFLGNQFFPGNYSQLENHVFIGSINLSPDTGRNRNNLGLKLVSEKEGEFIVRPKAYLSYAWHTAIVKDYHLSAGIHLGFAGYIFKPTNVSAEGSAFAPDADVGIGFYNEGLVVGISLNQALNSILTPKVFSFRYRRFSTINLEKKWNINKNYSLLFNYQHQSFRSFQQNNSFGIHFLLNRLFLAGVYVIPAEKLTFSLGFQDILYHTSRFKFIFGYNIPLKMAAQSRIQSFELMLTYKHL
jgi:hypothetical protein